MSQTLRCPLSSGGFRSIAHQILKLFSRPIVAAWLWLVVSSNGSLESHFGLTDFATLPPLARGALQRARGTLHLAVKRRGAATVLADLRQDGCLKARFPRIAGRFEAVTLNSSGGVAGGDVLEARFAIGPGAAASFASRFLSLPSARRRSSRPFSSVATPAES